MCPSQRRKLESDELQMRTFFEEGDLLVAEVQAIMGDGSMSLHTRSLRYGKVSIPHHPFSTSFPHYSSTSSSLITPYSNPSSQLIPSTLTQPTNPHPQLRNGQLVTVPPILVKRLKSHFITLPCDVDLILGLNGYIWVSKHVLASQQVGEEGFRIFRG